jgi:hypothetical protein
MTSVVGYSFNADTYCEDCTMDYARSVPYSEYDFQEYGDEDITSEHNPGIFNMTKAIELEVIKDDEGNSIHPIFSIDDAGDTPDHCCVCGAFIDNSWSGETVSYVIEGLGNHIEGYIGRNEFGGGNVLTLDTWADNLSDCWISAQDEDILAVYKFIRERQNA